MAAGDRLNVKEYYPLYLIKETEKWNFPARYFKLVGVDWVFIESDWKKLLDVGRLVIIQNKDFGV